MIKNFRHTCIVVRNLDKSLKFYRDILGLRVSKVLNVEGKYPETVLNIRKAKLTYVKLHCPYQTKDRPPIFELHYWKNPRILPKRGYNHISFTVEDIDYEYKRLTKLGVKFLSPPLKTPYSNTKVCFGYDPDNNLIEFVEEFKK